MFRLAIAFLTVGCVPRNLGQDGGRDAPAYEALPPMERPFVDATNCDPVTQIGCPGGGQCEIDFNRSVARCIGQQGTVILGGRCRNLGECLPGLQCDDGQCQRVCRSDSDCPPRYQCMPIVSSVPGLAYCVR